LGAKPDEVKLASRSRKGYWRMSSNRIVQQAMTNRWLEDRGVPNMRTLWIKHGQELLCLVHLGVGTVDVSLSGEPE
jgi:hypothetical protein